MGICARKFIVFVVKRLVYLLWREFFDFGRIISAPTGLGDFNGQAWKPAHTEFIF
jgi:hypothetical protein